MIDIGHEKNAVREAQALQIPIIGIVDTNHNPEGIDYIVAGNDDSIRAISYYAREIANAILEAKASISPTLKKTEKKPAVKTEKKPAVKTEKKPAVKTEKKPAVKTEKKPAVKKTTTKENK